MSLRGCMTTDNFRYGRKRKKADRPEPHYVKNIDSGSGRGCGYNLCKHRQKGVSK